MGSSLIPHFTMEKIWKFHVAVSQTTSKHCSKKRAARAARLFFSFNQSNHWFVPLSLPSSNLKLPYVSKRISIVSVTMWKFGVAEKAKVMLWNAAWILKNRKARRNIRVKGKGRFIDAQFTRADEKAWIARSYPFGACNSILVQR